MQQLGTGFYWQDLQPGDRFRSWGRTVLEADIASFINLIGMHEVVFSDREFLREKSVIKRHFAPGALVYSFAEGLLLPSMQGTGMAFLNMELDIKRPCFAGDTIHVEVEVLEASRQPGTDLDKAAKASLEGLKSRKQKVRNLTPG